MEGNFRREERGVHATWKWRLTALLATLLLLGLVLVNAWSAGIPEVEEARAAMDMVLSGFASQTGAGNAVTSVYLNYRLFDTLLETLLLAVSVTGIVYFLEEKGREDSDESA